MPRSHPPPSPPEDAPSTLPRRRSSHPPGSRRSRTSVGLRVSALAVRSRRANAIGLVRISLLPDHLAIELFHVARFAPGFVTPGLAEPAVIRAPYSAVRGLFREGGVLVLSLDPRVVSPHNRFALAWLSDAPPHALVRASALREWLGLAAWVLPMLGTLAALAWVPERVAAGLLGRASLGALVAATIALGMRALVSLVTRLGAEGEPMLALFEGELAARLGITPLPGAEPSLASLPAPSPARVGPSPSRLRELVFVGGATLAALAGVTLVRAVRREAPAKMVAQRAELALGERVASLRAQAMRVARASVATRETEPPPEPCRCPRPADALFPDGLPVLSVHFARDADDASGTLEPELRGRRGRYRFDVVVVNGSDRPVADVRLVFTFARRDRRGARVGATDRGLYAQSIGPGEARKWTVEAPGTEVRWELSASGIAGPKGPLGSVRAAGLGEASSDAFARLGRARQRSARLYAATVLVARRDARGAALLASLGAPSKLEARAFEAVTRASSALVVCDARDEQGLLSACVANLSSAAHADVEVVDPTQDVSFPVGVEIPAGEGVRRRWARRGDALPERLVARSRATPSSGAP